MQLLADNLNGSVGTQKGSVGTQKGSVVLIHPVCTNIYNDKDLNFNIMAVLSGRGCTEAFR